jgi:hypothetical protein
MNENIIEASAHTTASPAVVFDLLCRGATWPEWSNLESFELESEGPAGGETVGAVRIFRTGRTTSRELVIAVEENQRFGYELLSGLPLRGYRAFVTLDANDDGATTITWRSTFRPKVPGTGWIYQMALGKFIRTLVRDLAVHASQQPAVS